MLCAQGPIANLGDASPPTLPYQGHGAAMAVEDGAVLGLLLDKFQREGLPCNPDERHANLGDLFHLYEGLRKVRTETNVAGAVHTRHYYHLADGNEQMKRDKELAELADTKWQGRRSFNWGDATYEKSLLGFDVLAEAERSFDL
jgi:salicylate hydroxylase